MERSDLRQQLQELSFSAVLSEPVLDQIVAVSSLVEFRSGAVLFREGSVIHTLYIICRGGVALEMCVPARGCVRLLSLGPGDMVAWSALLGGGTMTTTAVAIEDTQVIAIAAPELLRICNTHPDVGHQVMRRMAQSLAQRLVATRLQLMDLFSTEPPLVKAVTE